LRKSPVHVFKKGRTAAILEGWLSPYSPDLWEERTKTKGEWSVLKLVRERKNSFTRKVAGLEILSQSFERMGGGAKQRKKRAKKMRT